MCSRYALHGAGETALPLALRTRFSHLCAKDIRPSDTAPLLTADGVALATWGFFRRNTAGLVIHARCESAREKPLFRSAFVHGRCAAPASCFFEWHGKRKHRFSLPADACFYIAALCGVFDGEHRFVLLTTAANESVAPVHDRMPLLLPETALQSWLCDETAARALLASTPPPLVCDPPAERRVASFSLF